MHVIGHIEPGVSVDEKMQALGQLFAKNNKIVVEVPALGTMTATVGKGKRTTLLGETVDGGSRWTISGEPDFQVMYVLRQAFPTAFQPVKKPAGTTKPVTDNPATTTNPAAATKKGTNKKTVVAIVAAVVVVAGLISAFSDNSDDSSSDGSAAAASAGGGTSNDSSGVEFMPSSSYCDQAASEARIYVVFTLKNNTSENRKVQVMARRRYTDGSSNDSLMDEMEAEVGPYETQTFRGPGFDYNAEKHLLIECYLHFVGDSGNEVSVAVR